MEARGRTTCFNLARVPSVNARVSDAGKLGVLDSLWLSVHVQFDPFREPVVVLADVVGLTLFISGGDAAGHCDVGLRWREDACKEDKVVEIIGLMDALKAAHAEKSWVKVHGCVVDVITTRAQAGAAEWQSPWATHKVPWPASRSLDTSRRGCGAPFG